MLTNPKPLGFAFGEILTSAQMNSVTSQLPNAVDGIGGGSYALVAPLSITGQLVTLDDLTVADDLIVNGDTVLGNADTDTLTVVATAAFNNSLTAGSSSADALTVNATSTFNSPITLNDTITCGNININGDAALGNAVGDTATLNAILAIGTGRIRTKAISQASGGALDVAGYRHVKITGSALNTAISFTGAADDDWFTVYNSSVNTQTLSGIVSGTLVAGEGFLFVRVSGSWDSYLRTSAP